MAKLDQEDLRKLASMLDVALRENLKPVVENMVREEVRNLLPRIIRQVILEEKMGGIKGEVRDYGWR